MKTEEQRMLNKTWADERLSLKEGAYVAGIQFNYLWTPEEKQEFKKLWKEGRGIMYIAKHFNRFWVDVFILAADFVDRGILKERERPFFQ